MPKGQSRKGQSIVEAMVALGVLTTGFLGMVGLLTQSFVLSRTTSNELKATYLASEGIEVAKNILDHDTYDTADNFAWGTFDNVDTYGPGSDNTYELEYDTGEQGNAMVPLDTSHCTSGLGDFLSYDPSTGLYGYAGGAGNASIFKRCIEIDKSPDGNEITVDAMVSWSENSVPDSLTLEDHFYNWIAAASSTD